MRIWKACLSFWRPNTNPFNNYGHNKISLKICCKFVRQTDNLRNLEFNPLERTIHIYQMGKRLIRKFNAYNKWSSKKLSKLKFLEMTIIRLMEQQRDYVHFGHCSGPFISLAIFTIVKFIWSFQSWSGRGISVLELIDTFQRVNKVKVPYFFGRRKKETFRILC